MGKEIFKAVEGFEGLYEVSNFGNVKSLERKVGHRKGGLQTLKERILKPSDNTRGYLFVCLRKGKDYYPYVHRLVAIAFIPNPENKPQVNHKDGNKTNNRLDNLEWNTRRENEDHAMRTGLVTDVGENHHNSKLKNTDIVRIRELAGSKQCTRAEIAKMFNCSVWNILTIVKRKTWRHVE